MVHLVNRREEKGERFLLHLAPLERQLETFARRLLFDSGQVEDALQNAIATAFKDFDLYAEGTNFRAWIFRYLTFEIYNRNRRLERQAVQPIPSNFAWTELPEILEQETAFEKVLEDPDLVLDHFDEFISDALQSLSPLERSSLLLRAIGEFSYREISEILAIPVGSVMGYLSRARIQMRRRLTERAQQSGRLSPNQTERFS